MRAVLELALQTGKQVEIMYEAKSGSISKRTIYIFSFRNERLVAYCYLRNHMRSFDVNRVLAMEIRGNRLEILP